MLNSFVCPAAVVNVQLFLGLHAIPRLFSYRLGLVSEKRDDTETRRVLSISRRYRYHSPSLVFGLVIGLVTFFYEVVIRKMGKGPTYEIQYMTICEIFLLYIQNNKSVTEYHDLFDFLKVL